MERLTDKQVLERERECVRRNEYHDNCDRDCAKCDLLMGTSVILDAYDHAIELLKAEEEQRLVLLPCRVGDTVYKLWYTTCRYGNDYPDSMGCDGCVDECDLKRCVVERKMTTIAQIVGAEFGKDKYSYFLTREEAEAALKKAGHG